ncbi:MAG: DUF86 domain-containing protein [Nitrospiraceae bacterium]|nr:DUF86 domain-containing protein [Nitrospiraceae bacterium]
MSNPRDIALLMDIATAAERIITFTEGMDEASFEEDSRTHLAVQHQIMVIGEAAKRLSPDLQNEISEIPWSAVARMRDRLIHGYDTVDLEVIWDTVRQNIPSLLKAIRKRLADLKTE